MNPVVLVLPGMVLMLGVILVVSAFRPEHVRLGDALASLGTVAVPGEEAPTEVPSGERLGAWLLGRRPTLVTPAQRRALELRDRTVTAHVTRKAVGAVAGFLAPLVLGLLLWVGAGVDPALPAVFSVVGGLVGFVAPDIALHSAAKNVSADATEALLTFFDLVTLERLANQSATQALQAAANLSDVAVFRTIRGALDRARLEQRMPYADLKQVGRDLDLPALVDLADVMALDDSGAALSGTLRARVKELRDGHLTEMKVAAAAVSERMTIFMVIPSLVFALLFLVPALLRLVQT